MAPPTTNPATTTVAPTLGSSQPVSTTSVLLVEDEEAFVDALVVGLKREGFTIEVARDGAEALDLFDEVKPDLVLLDVMLPEVSGYEICQTVRMDPALKDVKILMMTARGSTMERRKGLALGADGFIAKPFELKELRDEVRRLLDDGAGGGAGGDA